jgi:uncharacterized phage protein (TIGR02218 family)
MKAASAATLAILEGRQYLLAELYDITLIGGQVYHFTNFQVPVTAAVYPSSTKNTYQTGLTIKRGTLTQKTGTEAANLELTITPQLDSPNYPVLVAGYSILTSARLGLLDGATVQLSKLFMNMPAAGAAFDTSPGAVSWFYGTIQDIQVTRFNLLLKIDDYLAYLANQQMPKQLFGVGCFHEVYDAGCTLLKSAFTSSGHVTAVTDRAHFTTNLTQADDYFDLGVLTFTSGVNNGQQVNVASYKNASGAIVCRFPFPSLPAVNDTFTIYPGCDKQQSTCTTKFSNLPHFSGNPYTPDPSTIVDGGTTTIPQQSVGGQSGQYGGSSPSGGNYYGPNQYKY